jgi:hypothetical protein
MQPYFLPYAGYFRLLATTDLFVLYDCVQFPRRGWLHRNRLLDRSGEMDWLTLPLQKAPQDTLIRDLVFRPSALRDLEAQFVRFPSLGSPSAQSLVDQMRDMAGSPVDYIERLLRFAALELGLPWRTIRSSTLGVQPDLRGQDRILAIARMLGASTYVNPPGGRELYDASRFEAAGVELRFLPPHEGSFASIAERLAVDSRASIATEVAAGSRLLV